MAATYSKIITIRIPRLNLVSTLHRSLDAISDYLFSVLDSLKAFRRRVASSQRTQFKNPLPSGNKIKKVLPLTILVIGVSLTVVSLGRAFLKSNKSQSSITRVSIAGAKATKQHNREFTFPLEDSKGNTFTTMKFTLETAELRDEIIVDGKRAIAIEGRTFLILTFKITSDFNKAMKINPKNYSRLTKNGQEADLLAADIHNDPVVVQPTSTKYTRIGWPINDTDATLVLLVGD